MKEVKLSLSDCTHSVVTDGEDQYLLVKLDSDGLKAVKQQLGLENHIEGRFDMLRQYCIEDVKAQESIVDRMAAKKRAEAEKQFNMDLMGIGHTVGEPIQEAVTLEMLQKIKHNLWAEQLHAERRKAYEAETFGLPKDCQPKMQFAFRSRCPGKSVTMSLEMQKQWEEAVRRFGVINIPDSLS